MMIRGAVDVVSTTEVRGWAFATGNREPVLVQAILNHEILGEAIANLPRPDLAAAGVGDGKSGFVMNLFRPIDALYLPFIVVKIDGGDAQLPRAPTLGFQEFFGALYTSHPTTGRSRSVFGGLWTDRTDAVALLRGKIEIGQIEEGTTGLLVAQLVEQGFAVFNLPQEPVQHVWHDRLQERIGEVIEDVALLTVLRVVLEDNPMVVRAGWVAESETAFSQPSTSNPSPSPAECVEVIVPFGNAVVLDIVRDSFCLPEFTPNGISRWASRSASDGVSLAAEHGLLDSKMLHPGNVAVVSPGSLFRVRIGNDSAAVRALCLPCRGFPVELALDAKREENTRVSGVRVWA